MCEAVCLYLRACVAHAGHIGTDRSLLMGHDALRLQQIAEDIVHAVSHRYDNTWQVCWYTNQRYWLEQVGGMVT